MFRSLFRQSAENLSKLSILLLYCLGCPHLPYRQHTSSAAITVTPLSKHITVHPESKITRICTSNVIRKVCVPDRCQYTKRMVRMLWPDSMNSLDQNGLAPLTREVQRWIWAKQHPVFCEKQKLVTARNGHGDIAPSIVSDQTGVLLQFWSNESAVVGAALGNCDICWSIRVVSVWPLN